MTASTIELTVRDEDRHVAWLAAAAVGLSLVEAALPSPIPGLKPGLANVVTLLVLLRYGWRLAVWVTLLRVVATALLLGNFLTPGFVLSLAGALAALGILGTAHHLLPRGLGPVGLSVLAAFAHVGMQLAVVDLWLLPGATLVTLAPLFLSAAWLTGLVNGLVVAGLLARLPQTEGGPLVEPTASEALQEAGGR